MSLQVVQKHQDLQCNQKISSDGKIIVINKKADITPEEELTTDVLQIMNIFVAKMNGMRKYKKLKIDNEM